MNSRDINLTPHNLKREMSSCYQESSYQIVFLAQLLFVYITLVNKTLIGLGNTSFLCKNQLRISMYLNTVETF